MRYETQKAKSGYGRYSSKENHDIAYNGLLVTVENAEKSKNISIIRIFDHNYQRSYINYLQNGEWEKAPEGSDFIKSIRNKPMTLDELHTYVNNYAILKEMICELQRNASEEQVIDIQKRYEQSIVMLNNGQKNGTARIF